jgi:iron(III) transport system substrate-binding protein
VRKNVAHRLTRRHIVQIGLAATLFARSPEAHAQAGPFTYAGPDRMARLIAGAKKEGSVTLYSSAISEHMADVIAGFQKKYGVKVSFWRGGSEEILQRTVTEARGRRYDVDVVETSATQIEPIYAEKLLAPVKTPIAAEFMPGSTVPGRPWFPSRLIVITGAYNTNLIKPADLPKSYDDLLNPKWKGKLGIEAEDNNFLFALAGALGEARALKLFRDIVTTNGISVRKGHTLMANLVASGEVPVALTIYHHEVEPLKKAGAPINQLDLPPTIAFVSGAGVAARAPHPNAAMLFLEYLLSEGQPILERHGNLSPNVKYQHLPAGMKLTFIDVPKYMAEFAKWNRLYKDILSRQRR